jgi:hypothetical protein
MLLFMENGTWAEGRDSGETNHSAGDTFIEDKDTVHWFYNRDEEPATALVCDSAGRRRSGTCIVKILPLGGQSGRAARPLKTSLLSQHRSFGNVFNSIVSLIHSR